MAVNLADVITCAKFQDEVFSDYNFTGVEFPIFLLIFARASSVEAHNVMAAGSHIGFDLGDLRLHTVKKGSQPPHRRNQNLHGCRLADFITCAKFQDVVFMDYNFTGVEFPIFLLIFAWAL